MSSITPLGSQTGDIAFLNDIMYAATAGNPMYLSGGIVNVPSLSSAALSAYVATISAVKVDNIYPYTNSGNVFISAGIATPFSLSANNLQVGGVLIQNNTITSNPLFGNLPLTIGGSSNDTYIISQRFFSNQMFLLSGGFTVLNPVSAISGTTLFNINSAGFVTMYAPVVSAGSDGAFSLIGSKSGNFQNVSNQGSMMHITGNDNQAARVAIDGFGTGAYANLIMRSGRNTAGTPLSLSAGDIVARIAVAGWAGTSFLPAGSASGPNRLEWVATNDFSSTSDSMRADFWLSKPGTNNGVIGFSIDGNSVSARNIAMPYSGATLTFGDGTQQSTAYTPYNAVVTPSVTTGSYNVLPTDYYIGVNYGGKAIIQLPNGVKGKIYVVKDESGVLDALTKTITVSAQPGQLIDGINSTLLVAPYSSATFIYGNTGWYVI